MATKATGTSLEFIIHPGEIISDMLTERGITQSELAKRTGVSEPFISGVLAGKKNISASFAMALEYALSVPKSFWLNLQANYDAEMLAAEEAQSVTTDELSVVKDLKDIIKYLRQRGIIPVAQKATETVLSLRKALRVSNIENLSRFSPAGAFRIADRDPVNNNVLGAWLQLCQIASSDDSLTTSFNPDSMDELVREIKGVMIQPNVNPQQALPPLLDKYGISFSIVRHFRGAPVHGYISSKQDGQYQLVLTIRGAWADVFWFSLFHELGHIKNGDVTRSSYFMDLTGNSDNAREKLADMCAANMLIDPTDYKAFIAKGDYSIEAIGRFATTQSVPPFIVIGRLQKEERIPYKWYAQYKPRFHWVS